VTRGRCEYQKMVYGQHSYGIQSASMSAAHSLHVLSTPLPVAASTISRTLTRARLRRRVSMYQLRMGKGHWSPTTYG
jgi:hypothetical protein